MIEIPELALAVSAYLNRNDIAHLGCTSRHMFDLFMPLAWETVSGVALIFVLLPGAKVERRSEEDIIILPNMICNLVHSRFCVYSGFIKRLEVFPAHRNYTLKNWQGALSYTEDHFLLPELTSVVFESETFGTCPQYLWMCMVLSPRLQEFRVAIPDSMTLPRTPFSVAHTLSIIMRDKCHELRHLTIFPSPGLQPHPDETYLIKDCLKASKDSLLLTDRIEDLCTNMTMLQGLSSSLSALTRLRVYDVYLSEDYDCSRIPRQSFPKLRRFGAYNLANRATMEGLWQIIGPSSQQITHLELDFLTRFWRTGGWPHGDSPVLTEVISFLVARSSQITDLSIHNLPAILYEIQPVPAASVIELLQNLRLERLCIIGARLENMLDIISQDIYIHLRKLELPHELVPVNVLPYFAKFMPNLEHLCLDLQLESINETPKCELQAPALRVLKSDFLVFDQNSYQLSSKFMSEGYITAYSLARTLYALYPSVQLESHSNVSNFLQYRIMQYLHPQKAIDLINLQLKTLSIMNQGPQAGTINFDSVTILNEERWNRCFV